MKFFSRFILRHAGWVALAGTLIAFIGAFYTVALFKNLRTDFEELLPTNARSVTDLKEVVQRLEAIDSLGVLVFSKDAEAGKRFVEDLAKNLSQAPETLIASVEYRIDQELKFFRERQALYIDLPDLIRVRDYIRARIEYEKELFNPLNIFKEEFIPEPKLDFAAMRKKYEAQTSAYARFPGGYYATPDGTKRVVLVYKPGGSGMDATIALKKAVDEAVSHLNPTSYAPDLEVHYTGNVQEQIEEHEALIEDLALSTVIVTLLVGIGMWWFYRSFRATWALLLSLFMGTFWTFGVSYFTVGYLNANSAFMGSIVIGNGINFGIILMARYMEELRKLKGNARSIMISMRQTATSTWTAALAAGLSYGSLILTDFRGFRQFGIIGLFGMVLCWISAFTLLPAYLTLLNRIKPLFRKGDKVPKAYVAGALATFVQRRAFAICVVSAALSVVSLATFVRYTPNLMETNLTKLRSRQSVISGAAFMSQYLNQIFQHYLSPVVILPRTREETTAIAAHLRQKKEEQGPKSFIASVQTMDDFIPKDQEAKIQVMRQIRQILPPSLVRRLPDADQAQITEFLSNASLKPLKMEDLPGLVLSKFTERDGTVGKLVLIEPPLGPELWEGRNLTHFVNLLRDAADSARPGTAVAGSLPITSDMIDSVTRDGPKATLFAFLAVVLLVVILFRNLQTITLALFALLLGILWLAGLILGADLKINFLNFIALPITFGIGVDYGVNMFQRYRQEKASGILSVIRNTGGAVGMCSYTTMIGYVSLLIASNQGFVSFGILAVAGELTCVIAAVITMPAYLLLKSQRKPTTAA